MVAKRAKCMGDKKSILFRSPLLISSFIFQIITWVAGLTIPIYAAYLGATPSIVGIIGATGGALYSFMTIVSGFLSDRFGRKTFIFISTLLYSASCLLYLLIEDPYLIIPIRTLEAFSLALFWPSLEALLVEVGKNEVERNLWEFNLSWGTATIIGPIIGGYIISSLGIKAPFLFSSISSIVLSIFIIIGVSELYVGRVLRSGYKVHGLSWRQILSIFKDMPSTFLFSFATGIIFNIFPAYALKLGIPAHEIGLMMLFVGLFRLLAFLGVYWLENKIGEVNIFLLGSVLMSLALSLTAVGNTAASFSASLSIFGFSIGLLYAASIARIFRNGRGVEGQTAGLFECILGIGYLFGPLLGGFAAEFSLGAPYILTSFLAAFMGILYVFRKMVRQKITL